MNTQERNASLANVEFNPDTLQFDGLNLSGLLEADDVVRESYFFNTMEDASKAELAFVQSQSLPVGVLLLNPSEYEPAEFGIEGAWGEGLSISSQAGAVTETLGYSLVSLEDEEAAATLQVKVMLRREEGQKLTLTFQPGSMLVKEAYQGHGHRLDLGAGACWLAQDIATCIYLNATPDTQIAVHVEPVNSSPESYDLGLALAATLEGVRVAVESELENAASRCAAVELKSLALEAA
jgi:hypothetical protein